MTPLPRSSARSLRTPASSAVSRAGAGSTYRRPCAQIDATGFHSPYYGVEIISKAYRAQSLEVMARTSFETTKLQVDLARTMTTQGEPP